jgi:hypothetical protein
MWKIKIKQYWNENPLEVIAIMSAATYSVAKLIDAVSSAQGRHAYAKQVNYRVNK